MRGYSKTKGVDSHSKKDNYMVESVLCAIYVQFIAYPLFK